MFKELLDIKYKRSVKQAVGFYIFHIIISTVLGGILSGLIIFGLLKLNLIVSQTSGRVGMVIGANFAIIYYFFLSLILLLGKKLYTSISAILLFLLTIIATILMGGLLGCICPAILSTFESKNN